ncbi:GFA family protein [Photobacterium sp. DNB22_13_2]
MTKVTGSCSCCSIKYQITGPVQKVVNCHCDHCKKMNGSAISTYVAVLDSDFVITQGEVKQFAISEKASKYFCGDCGTPLFNEYIKHSGLKMLHLGGLDSINDLTPSMNLYSESQTGWIGDVSNIPSLKQKKESESATDCSSSRLTWSDLALS